ncbi:MAG: hypothetical protein C5B55_10240 [Blastocatellia bacterium]|nr:MAG: hypothetical protein C5B55_10240 [Blastocatellia bacterium]
MNRIACCVLFLAISATAAAQTSSSNQKTSRSVSTSPLCTHQNAIDTLQQQIASSKTFNNPVQRIDVLLRSADLLWPYERDKSLATFLEAFELAKQHFKENGDNDKQDSKFHRTSVPDQRYKVIAAFAKRAPNEAKKLSEQIMADETADSDNPQSNSREARRKTDEKLLTLAHSLASTDQANSIKFARASLSYPASLWLPLYLYELSKANKLAADQFYEEALQAYASAPMDEYLYLSSYPFGNSREVGEMPGWMIYKLPEGFFPNVRLQRLFVQHLLTRVQAALQAPIDAVSTNRFPDSAQMWMALSRLENPISQSLADLAPATTEAKDKLFALLSAPNQKQVTSTIEETNRPKLTFDEQVEAADKQTDVGRRDMQLTFAITGARDVPLDKVVAAIEKISDESVRQPLLSWLYFFRSQSLIAEKKLEEAHELAAKTTELDQRAYLYARIAEELLKESKDQTRVREILNELGEATSKAPKTIVTARALLALANFYTRIDANRGIEELAHAVKAINDLESPDFSVQYVTIKIEGKTFGSYSGFSTPGFDPQTVFSEVAKSDFDGSLIQAATLTDKVLRSLTTLAVIEPCLEVVPAIKPQKKKQ